MRERHTIRRLGGELVVFYNAELELIESWRRRTEGFPGEVAVLADPRAALYDELGTIRRGNYLSLTRGSFGAALKSAAHGRIPRATSADMLRLGADAAVRPDGEIATLHRATAPQDRVPMAALVASLG